MPIRCRAGWAFGFLNAGRKNAYKFGVCAQNWVILAACGLWCRGSCDKSMSKTAPTSVPAGGLGRVSPPIYLLPPAHAGYRLRFVTVNPVRCFCWPVRRGSEVHSLADPPVLCLSLGSSETSPFVPVVQQCVSHGGCHAFTFRLFPLSAGAAIAGVYRAAGKKMIPFEALILGVGQTFCVVVVSFLRILATL